jgi:hypothetical protein
VTGVAALDGPSGTTGLVAFTVLRGARGNLGGVLVYANFGTGLALSSDQVHALSLTGTTATFAGAGECADLHSPTGSAALRPLSGEHTLTSAEQRALRQAIEQAGAPCTFTLHATDGGPNGRGDAVTLHLSGFGTDGGPVRNGDVRVTSSG